MPNDTRTNGVKKDLRQALFLSPVSARDFPFTALENPGSDVRVITDSMFAAGASTAFLASITPITNGTFPEAVFCSRENFNLTLYDRKVPSPGKSDVTFFVRLTA